MCGAVALFLISCMNSHTGLRDALPPRGVIIRRGEVQQGWWNTAWLSCFVVQLCAHSLSVLSFFCRGERGVQCLLVCRWASPVLSLVPTTSVNDTTSDESPPPPLSDSTDESGEPAAARPLTSAEAKAERQRARAELRAAIDRHLGYDAPVLGPVRQWFHQLLGQTGLGDFLPSVHPFSPFLCPFFSFV